MSERINHARWANLLWESVLTTTLIADNTCSCCVMGPRCSFHFILSPAYCFITDVKSTFRIAVLVYGRNMWPWIAYICTYVDCKVCDLCLISTYFHSYDLNFSIELLNDVFSGGAYIREPPRNQTVSKGDSVYFKCLGRAAPNNITTVWYKDGIDINNLHTLRYANMDMKDFRCCCCNSKRCRW